MVRLCFAFAWSFHMIRFLVPPILAFLVPGVCFAQSCDGYPYSPGINLEEWKGSLRLLSTASAPLAAAEQQAVKEARGKAESAARAALTEFLSAGIRKNSELLYAVESTPSMKGEAEFERRDVAVALASSIANTANQLVAEIAFFRTCTVPGQEVRATVVVRPEAAKRLLAAANSAQPVQ